LAEDLIREQCEKRLAGLKAARQPYEADWEEIAQLAAPARCRFLGNRSQRRRSNRALFDGHARRSFRTLASGMTSGLSSRSRPWFRITLPDADLASRGDVAAWLGAVEEMIYRFLGRTNFYTASQSGYQEIGLFGTEATVMIEHAEAGAVCHSLTAGEYWIAQSDALAADTLYRCVPMSTLQCVQAFGLDAVSPAVRDRYDRSCYDDIVSVFHAIEPNMDRDEDRQDLKGKRFRSIWWDEGESDRRRLLRVAGYHEQPFWAPRWETTGGEVYGTSPGFDALADMRELQMQARRKSEAVDMHIRPEIIVPPQVQLRRVPGSVVAAAGIDAEGIKIPYQVPYQTIGVIAEDIERCQRAIDVATYADLFMAITNMPGVQPRNMEEIASRNEEKLTQLGPVIERVENEKLQVAIDRAFAILWRGGLLPTPPRELAGQSLKIEFVSILAQMQRMIGLGQIERTLGFAGSLAASHPEIMDLIDADAVLREYADRAGTPPRLLRDAAAVAQIRGQRQQAQAMQQAMAAVPAMRGGADALKTLSETDGGGGQSMLGRIMAGVGAAAGGGEARGEPA